MEEALLYINNYGDLTLKYKEEGVLIRLINKDAYKEVKGLTQTIITDAFNMNDELVLHFKNLKLRIRDYEKILKSVEFKFLIEKIKKHEENKQLKRVKGKRVERINKYADEYVKEENESKLKQVGTKIILTTLAALVVYTSVSEAFTETKGAIIEPKSTSVGTTSSKISTDVDIIDIINQTNVKKEKNSKKNTASQTIESDINSNTDVQVINLNYEDQSQTEKALGVKNNYEYNLLFEKYAKIYGLDSDLIKGIATTEGVYHDPYMNDGGATGLMQLQNEVWVGNSITAYNFEIEDYETEYVTEYMLSDLETNIKLACMYIRHNLDYYQNNLPLAIQCYNYGEIGLDGIIENYCIDSGKDYYNVISNPNDLGWLDYRYNDWNYVETVMSWLGKDVNITILDHDKNEIKFNFNNSLTKNKQNTY